MLQFGVFLTIVLGTPSCGSSHAAVPSLTPPAASPTTAQGDKAGPSGAASPTTVQPATKKTTAPLSTVGATAASGAPTRLGFSAAFSGTDDAGYTFTGSVDVRVGPASVSVTNAPPGQADVTLGLGMKGTITNTTGRAV